MRIRRVIYAVAVGAMLSVSVLAAPAQAGDIAVATEPILSTLSWGHGG